MDKITSSYSLKSPVIDNFQLRHALGQTIIKFLPSQDQIVKPHLEIKSTQ